MMGKFEHRIEVQRLKEVESGFEDRAGDQWETLREEMFMLRPKGGREYEQADQMQSNVSMEARCVHFQGANSSMRLRYGNRVFHVDSVINEMERNKFLVWRLVEVDG